VDDDDRHHDVQEVAPYDAFVREWNESNTDDLRLLWQLLGQLTADGMLVHDQRKYGVDPDP
jgi:hypothetical protein